MLYTASFLLPAPDQHPIHDAFYKYKNLCNCLDKAGRGKKKAKADHKKRVGVEEEKMPSVDYTVQENPEFLQKLKGLREGAGTKNST